MKLWLILYYGTHIGGTWGPLPHDMHQCQLVAAERQLAINKMVETKTGENGNPIPAETVEKLKIWRLSCEYRATRPSLGEQQ